MANVKVNSWREGYAHILNSTSLAELNESTSENNFQAEIESGAKFLVAIEGEKVVAYSLWIQLSPDSPIENDWLYPNMLASLYVHPDHYGKGIGTALIRANAKLALDHSHSGMMIGVFRDNLRAKSLYIHLGAQFVKSGTWPVDGIHYPDEHYAFHDLNALTSHM